MTRPEASPNTNGTLAEDAYNALCEGIVTLQLPPGSVLHEERLMEKLGMGRSPIRDALRRLANESLVVIHPRRGTFVAEMDIGDLARIVEVRVELEGLAAALAARRFTESRLEPMQQLLADLEGLAADADVSTRMALDHRVHSFIYAATDNDYLEATLAQYYTLALRLWYRVLDHMPRYVAAVSEHKQLLAAIKAKDPKRARSIARAHEIAWEAAVRRAI